MSAECELCQQEGGKLVVPGPRWRVVRVLDELFPAFYRVIWTAHVAEFSDLGPEHRSECLEVVVRVEQEIRRALKPTKINLASLGNMVPHLHWHVVARFDWDTHFPHPVWASRQREPQAERLAAMRAALEPLDQAMASALSDLALSSAVEPSR
jgi:diadenosine tetraphosphate (Ap4A) HIT family hydrolase